MGGPRRLVDRLSYANVVATLALFIALGGASYAAVELPAHSVGAQQLRAGAVTPEALGFPLGPVVFAPPTPFSVPPTPRCSDLPPGAQACAVAPRENLLLGHLHLHAPAEVVLSALLTLENSRPAVSVQIKLFVGASSVAGTSVEIGASETVQVPLQTLAFVAAGIHSIGLEASANYGSGRETVTLRDGTVIATAFPHGAAPGASKCTSSEALLC